jgi:plasmid stability protein
MQTIIIRRLDDGTKSRLRTRASRNGRSMEEEARQILKSALSQSSTGPRNLAEAMRTFFAPLGGVQLPEVRREPMREPPDFRNRQR